MKKKFNPTSGTFDLIPESFDIYPNGVTAQITPWTSDINGGGFSLTNVASETITGNIISSGTIFGDGGNLKNLPARTLLAKVISDTTLIVGTDNFLRLVIPEELNNRSLSSAGIHIYTASSTGSLTAMIRNTTKSVNMLLTPLKIDTNGTDSSASTSPYVLSGSSVLVNTADIVAINLLTSGTSMAGFECRMAFK